MQHDRPPGKRGIVYHPEFDQGSQQWMEARCGLLTGSEMKLIISPKLKAADNDRSRSHLNELLAQRITGHVEPHYISDDMLRGHEDEIEARALYEKNYGATQTVGFVTNDEWGFTIGCSPDWLVGDDGLGEAKSRRQKLQIDTIVTGEVPDDFIIQVQTELLVTRREWCDFVSYSGGLPMATIRVEPDPIIQEAIEEVATGFEAALRAKHSRYLDALASARRLIPTERKIEVEMF